MTVREYRLTATCGHCGGTLEHVNAARPCHTETSAICRCTECGVEWQIVVHMRRLVQPRSAARRTLRQEAAVA